MERACAGAVWRVERAPTMPGAPPMHGGRAQGATTLILVDKPGAAQSSFRFGGIGAPRVDQRLLRAAGAEHRARRIVHEPAQPESPRERKAIPTARARGSDFVATAGPFTASAEVVTAKTDSALIEFMKELRAIRDTVPTRRAGEGQAVSPARPARRLRDDRRHCEPASSARDLRHSARLLRSPPCRTSAP